MARFQHASTVLILAIVLALATPAWAALTQAAGSGDVPLLLARNLIDEALDRDDASALTILEATMAMRGVAIPVVDAQVQDPAVAWLAAAATAGRYPTGADEISGTLADFAMLTPEARGPLALLLGALDQSLRMHAVAVADMTQADRDMVASIVELDPEGILAIVDAGTMDRIDEAVMMQAAWVMQSAVESAMDSLEGQESLTIDGIGFEDPVGFVRVGSIGFDYYAPDQYYALSIDPAGDDLYKNPAGGAAAFYSPTGNPILVEYINPVMVTIDLGGDDVFDTTGPRHSPAVQGGAWTGVGILTDGAGNDRYLAYGNCQGLGFLGGVGLFFDKAGDDYYETEHGDCFGSATEASIGIHLDAEGADIYRTTTWTMGYAIFGSSGIFLNFGGQDEYGLRGNNTFGYIIGGSRDIQLLPNFAHFRDRGGDWDNYDVDHPFANNDAEWYHEGNGVGWGLDE